MRVRMHVYVSSVGGLALQHAERHRPRERQELNPAQEAPGLDVAHAHRRAHVRRGAAMRYGATARATLQDDAQLSSPSCQQTPSFQ